MDTALSPSQRAHGWGLAAAIGGIMVGWLWLAWYLNNVSDRPVRNTAWSIALLSAIVFVACGAAAWIRRPDTPIGRRMVIAGFLLCAEALLRSNNDWLFTVGDLIDGASAAVVAHIVVTYPSGRAESALERAVVVAGYATFVSIAVARATTTDFTPTCVRCPANHLYVGGYPGAFDTFKTLSVALVVGLVLAIAACVAVKWWHASHALRRVLVLPYASALLIVVVLLVTHPSFDNRGPEPSSGLVISLAVLTFPIALVIGLLRGHLARAAASDLLVELGSQPTLGLAAARALDDPTARLLVWDETSAVYMDDDGQPVPGQTGPGRRLAVIEASGRRLGALECDGALAEEPERLSAVVSAIGLALDRQRLAQEVREQLVEVASSRARIVTSADEERRRVERNLHDGAQQRLVGVSMLMQRARSRAVSRRDSDLVALLTQALTELDGSLADIRKLARGLQPPLLEERGLVPALEALAETSAVPTTVRGRLDRRLASSIETAAFFVASECLANVAKYAEATTATVTVDDLGSTVVVTVADDGRGGAEVVEGGGLGGLRDRVDALGGIFDVHSAAGRGTTVTARLATPP